MAGRRCRQCGCRLASDHLDDEWCTPCLLSRRDYDPRNDPFFLDEVLHYLILFSPERLDLIRVMGLQPEHRELVKKAIVQLRTLGFDIRAEQRLRGYRYAGVAEVSRIRPTASQKRRRIQPS